MLLPADSKRETAAEKMVVDIASQKNIPTKALKFITGNTKEEIEASIDDLSSLIAKNEKKEKVKIPSSEGKGQDKKLDMKELVKEMRSKK